jgi:hypothetical protein
LSLIRSPFSSFAPLIACTWSPFPGQDSSTDSSSFLGSRAASSALSSTSAQVSKLVPGLPSLSWTKARAGDLPSFPSFFRCCSPTLSREGLIGISAGTGASSSSFVDAALLRQTRIYASSCPSPAPELRTILPDALNSSVALTLFFFTNREFGLSMSARPNINHHSHLEHLEQSVIAFPLKMFATIIFQVDTRWAERGFERSRRFPRNFHGPCELRRNGSTWISVNECRGKRMKK